MSRTVGAGLRDRSRRASALVAWCYVDDRDVWPELDRCGDRVNADGMVGQNFDALGAQ